MRFEWGVLETVLVFGHLADHVVEDAAVMEVRELHVRVEPHLGLKRSACVQLQRGMKTKHISSNRAC